jgi:uncharacterized protein
MIVRLPDTIEPFHLADKRGSLKGHIPLNTLERMADLLYTDSGFVSIELFFGRSGNLANIEGTIKAVLELKCQNCLKSVEWMVDDNIKLGIVTTIEQADKLPEDFEPLLLEEESILLKDIVEDELLLILPAFPKHQHKCLVPDKSNNDNVNSSVKDHKSSPENPFSILVNLKTLENTNGSTKK